MSSAIWIVVSSSRCQDALNASVQSLNLIVKAILLICVWSSIGSVYSVAISLVRFVPAPLSVSFLSRGGCLHCLKVLALLVGAIRNSAITVW